MKTNSRTGALAALPLAALAAFAPHAAATNGDQMLGVTATQKGMAGAVVAAPQDATTMLVNPAGMAELGIRGRALRHGRGLAQPAAQAPTAQDSDSNWYLMPSGAVAFNVNDRLMLGMGMGGMSGSGVDFADTAAAPGNQAFVTTKQFFKIAPGFAYQVSDRLSLGATLNLTTRVWPFRTRPRAAADPRSMATA